ncbi:MAG: hypothetical protein ACE5KM_00940 [Planctomycetaceae bacterium]
MDPWLFVLLATLPVLLVAWMAMRTWVRRRELREVRRFESFPRTGDEEFLAALGIDRDSEDGEFALRLRDGLAMLGSVPGDSLRASHRFYPDLERLPYYDSPDYLALILLVEDRLEMPVPEGDHERELLHAAMKGSVGEFIGKALEWRRRQAVSEATA